MPKNLSAFIRGRARSCVPYLGHREFPAVSFAGFLERFYARARKSESPVNPNSHQLKNRTPLLIVGQKESEGLPTPADQSESEPTIFYRDDFVLLTDDIKYWIVRIEDISLLEAHRNFTLVHFPHGKLLIRRSLKGVRNADSSKKKASVSNRA
jgi:hypothetical protein